MVGNAGTNVSQESRDFYKKGECKKKSLTLPQLNFRRRWVGFGAAAAIHPPQEEEVLGVVPIAESRMALVSEYGG